MEQKTYTLEQVQAAVRAAAISKPCEDTPEARAEVDCCIKCAVWIAEEISKHL